MLRASLTVAVAIAVLALIAAPRAGAAPWCGTVSTTDRSTTVTGQQIRVIYAIGRDGVDRSTELAPTISADVDQIDTWWRAQDSATTPRFDRAAFPCGAQADLRLLRLPQSNGDLYSDAAQAVQASVTALDPVANTYKYLVYLDVPRGDPNLCGQGLGSFAGIGLAIVYLGACQSLQSASTAAHELLHAFGALPAGAPHACPSSSGHPCDWTGDILYPFAVPVPLTSYALDVGHDDYYGHSGTWLDLQDSRWLMHLDSQLPLAVTIEGGGRVASDLPGIDCTASCTTSWDGGAAISLIAQPADGQRFVRWTGGCQRAGAKCDVALAQAVQVNVLFAPTTYPLNAAIRGRGRVVGPGFTCRTTCSQQLRSYVSATVVATPAPGWRVERWAGPVGSCRGVRTRCTVPMSGATGVKVVFVRRR